MICLWVRGHKPEDCPYELTLKNGTLVAGWFKELYRASRFKVG